MTIGVARANRGRVLVTGASGFIGRWALSALRDQGFEAHGVGRERRADDPNWHQADLLDPGERAQLIAALRPEFLLHTAWYTDHGRFWTTPENEIWRGASLDLLRQFAAAGGRRAVFVGSCAEYDWLDPAQVPWREDRPCRPATLYGRAKLTLQQDSQEFAARAGVSFAWGRLFTPIGRHERPERLVPSLILALLKGEPATTGPGDLARDFMDVRDAGRAFAELVASDIDGPVNIAAGEALSIGEIARRIGELTGAASLLGIGRRPPRPNDAAYMVADVTRLTDELGFRPEFTLNETLGDAIDYWRAGRDGA